MTDHRPAKVDGKASDEARVTPLNGVEWEGATVETGDIELILSFLRANDGDWTGPRTIEPSGDRTRR